MLVRNLGFVLILTFISGCVHVPESLRVDEGTTLTNFSQVRENPTQYQGNLVRWGGVIAKVENNAQNTMLEIVHFTLKSSARPTVKDKTQGRFRVYYQGLLDPVIYKEGRSVTAVGYVVPSEGGKIGEHEYTYPVMKANDVHLWKEIKKVDVRVTHQPMWYSPSMWYYPRSYYPPIYYPHSKTKAKTNNSAKN